MFLLVLIGIIIVCFVFIIYVKKSNLHNCESYKKNKNSKHNSVKINLAWILIFITILSVIGGLYGAVRYNVGTKPFQGIQNVLESGSLQFFGNYIEKVFAFNFFTDIAIGFALYEFISQHNPNAKPVLIVGISVFVLAGLLCC